MSDLDDCFKAAQAAAKSSRNTPDNDTLLGPYSYYKQALEGDAPGGNPAPSISSPGPGTTPGRPAAA